MKNLLIIILIRYILFLRNKANIMERTLGRVN